MGDYKNYPHCRKLRVTHQDKVLNPVGWIEVILPSTPAGETDTLGVNKLNQWQNEDNIYPSLWKHRILF